MVGRKKIAIAGGRLRSRDFSVTRHLHRKSHVNFNRNPRTFGVPPRGSMTPTFASFVYSSTVYPLAYIDPQYAIHCCQSTIKKQDVKWSSNTIIPCLPVEPLDVSEYFEVNTEAKLACTDSVHFWLNS